MVQIKISSLTFVHFQVFEGTSRKCGSHRFSVCSKKKKKEAKIKKEGCALIIYDKKEPVPSVCVGELGRWDYLYYDLKSNHQC